MKYRLYTDGSSHAKGGLPGGWGAILVRIDADAAVPICCKSGGDAKTTNNIQELSGILYGLQMVTPFLSAGDELDVVSDSQYALNMAAGNWNPSSNQELIAATRREATARRQAGVVVKFLWVRGHNGEAFNERVDGLATRAKAKIVAELRSLVAEQKVEQ